MQVISDKEEMIFRKDYNGNPSYSIGLSKKNKDGKYENGYMGVHFKKGVDLKNQTKIKIKEAWLGFNQNEKKTYPYIFINDFEISEEPAKEVANNGKKEEKNPFEEFGDSIKTEFDVGQQIQIEDEDLPF